MSVDGPGPDQQADRTAPRTTRPALDVLDADQDRLLYGGDYRREPPIRALVDGWATYYDALVWYQAAGVRTLGHVERVLEPDALLPTRSLTRYCVGAGRHGREATYVRQRLAERLDDACTLAYRHLRQRAVERAGEDADAGPSLGAIDPAQEANPAMRPAFRKLDQVQAGALERLWLGFEDREAVSRWVRGLSAPTRGNRPDGLMDAIVATPALLERLLVEGTEDREAVLTRYRFALVELMPAFLKAARTLRGGEQHQSTSGTGGWKQA